MVDLTTTYLGLKLSSPLVASASPLSAKIDGIKQLADNGAAAIVLPSLFEEQIELGNLSGIFPERDLPDALRHIPDMAEYNHGASGYLAHIYQAKRAVNVPIIASLNGYYGGGWVQYGRLMEAAGADALELNIYYLATKPHISGDDVERMYLDLARDVKQRVQIPVAVKLNPYFSALANIVQRLDQENLDGLVLFNRFYQPDFNLETRTVEPSLDLSSSTELRLRLRWTALLSNLIKADIGITGGVHTPKDVLKSIAAGAQVTLIASALLEHGADYLQTLRNGIVEWLEAEGYDSLQSLRGSMSQTAVADAGALERANYMHVLKSLDAAQVHTSNKK